MNSDRERFDRGIVMSVGLHGVLLLFALLSPIMFPAYGSADWGSDTGGGEGISVEIVSSISGVPLPAPEVVNEDAVANESAGLYESEPEVEEAPVEEEVAEAELIPETTAPVETTPPSPPPDPAPPPPPADPEPDRAESSQPDNAVPFGQGGRPALNYGQFQVGDGTGGVELGAGAFGERYARYVEGLQRRISQNWLQSTVNQQIRSAPRVYVSFDILRDGTIANARIEESSGIRTLDNSALRAIYVSNPLERLPADFQGRSVSVRFWFEFKR